MNVKTLTAALLAALTLATVSEASASTSHESDGQRDLKEFREAVRLYDAGFLNRSRMLFDDLSRREGGADSKGYSVLCDVSMNVPGYELTMMEFFKAYPYSVHIPQIRYRHALNLFDVQDYKGASAEFSQIKARHLDKNQRTEFMFKRAYSDLENKELDKALDWITITMDELITEQQGNGIYAGLPWFNEYWGRDMFISMPGACLVTGQFDVAKEILKDFVKLQDNDPASETYGRIPNRANLEGILYNTTDGTPRLVIQALELAEYSGDTSFLEDIYPAIKISIDASIANYIDANGYLTHADADTWMDVKRNGIPGSPRGNRANDIQALWYGQLTAGSKIAAIMGDAGSAEQWSGLAQMLAGRFEQDFCNKEENMIYDHLNADGSPDIQFRPNQLYCFNLVNDDEFKQNVTRRTWEELVYPWGVASLAQWDQQFHPQHENWHYYHKDDAYHNGTIWLWNNGIAMQRMIEYGQINAAWELFKNMNRQALHEGAVGSLSENADAHPREGKTWVNRSGTFLQAWSNAEHLRVWYQYFLGIRPDLLSGVIVIEPKLPSEITYLETSVKIGKGTLHYKYADGKVDVKLEGIDAELEIHEPGGQTDSPAFEGLEFCKPAPLESYPCFATYHETALTY